MGKYNPQDIEQKWQTKWEKDRLFEADDDSKKPKFFGLIEFPYPSGAGLHVGHPRPFTAMDVISRKKRMEGYNVLFPIGFDAFGLPTENYAIKTGRAPADVTAENIANFTRQLKALGYSFDWSRVIDTTNPEYYKWTQWIFLQLFKHGLAYKRNIPINWCIDCKIGLANEEIVNSKCERCGGIVEKRDKEQWMLAITDYADSLLDGLKEVDYIPAAKVQQTNWIGRSEGATLKFPIVCGMEQADCDSKDQKDFLEVFTTRPDTIFGTTYMVVAPEHNLIKKYKTQIENYTEIENYIAKARLKSDLERTELQKEKAGIELKGLKAINPLTGEKISVWMADYVLMHYGTGAIMAVPAHDNRDFEFATKYNLPIMQVVAKDGIEIKLEQAYLGDGQFINSGFLNELNVAEAKQKIIHWLEENTSGERKVQFKLRDWIFSRQRYWGEPIPLVYCEHCAGQQNFKSKGEERNPGWIALDESSLPLKLPHVEKYEPTDTGESPLSAIKDWVSVDCPRCGNVAVRETDTMPNWAGSSWYFLRYCDSNNSNEFASQDMLQKWMSVDWYNGGMEHTVLHLLYSRFWNQFLHKIGLVPMLEPYKKRTSHGMILAKGGEKMSKSRGNVVSPDDMIDQFGADTLRSYIMFMGPFDQAVEWDTNGLVGVRRFLDRTWNLLEKAETSTEVIEDDFLTRKLHQTIKKVTNDIESMAFNTAIAAMMELVNEMTKQAEITQDSYEKLLKILSPFAPHMTEELWQKLGHEDLLSIQKWPSYNESLCKESTAILGIQINGKLRDEIELESDLSDDIIREAVLLRPKVQKYIGDSEIKKFIIVKGRVISIVI